MYKEKDKQLKTERYIGLSLVIILLLVLMFLVINLAYFMQAVSDEAFYKEYRHLEKHDHPNSDVIQRGGGQDYSFTLVAEPNSLVADGLKKAKIAYTNVSSLEETELGQDHLILDSQMLKGPDDLKKIQEYLKKEKTMIFLNMPDSDFVKANGLEEMLGIGTILGEKVEMELNLVPGFMLGGFHELRDMSYSTSEVQLLATTKVYGYGQNQAPLIWRNTYKGSEIYVINGPFMEGKGAYGILSALMSEIYQDYIYPVINTRLMIYDGFPYITGENKERLEAIYSRDAMKLQNDILLSDILTINKRRDFIPNGYLAAGFKEKITYEIGERELELVQGVQSQLYKAGGEVGLRYSGDIEYDLKMYQEIFPDLEIKSILLSHPLENHTQCLKVSDSLESIVGPWTGVEGFEYMDDHTVYIPITIDGIDHSGMEELEFLSAITAFGVMVENLNMEDIVLLKDDHENWQPKSRSYMKFLDTYRERFDFLENRDMTRTANTIQVFRNSIPKIYSWPNKIEIRFEHWCGKSHFILRTDKKIKKITNGEFKKIEEGAYLITSLAEKIDIETVD